MENFKKALKQGILEKADAVRFEELLCPQLLLYSAEQALNQLQVFSRAEVLELIHSLLPIPPSLQTTVREGVLSIVNFGEIKLLATTGEIARLFAFIPPQGNKIYQQIRNQIIDTGIKPVPKTINILENSSQFRAPGQPGHFAMGIPTINQPMAEGISYNQPHEESNLLAVPQKFSLPPFPPQGEAQNIDENSHTLIRPHDPGPIEMAEADENYSPLWTATAHPKPKPIISLREEVRESTVINNEKKLAFQAEEPTNSEDYHFNQSTHSQVTSLGKYSNGTHTNTTMPFIPSTSTSQTHESTAIEKVVSKSPIADNARSIHFGPTIPGETIVRTGPLPIDSMLTELVKMKGSDLHLTQAEPLCMRVDGSIVRVGETALTEMQMRDYILPIMPTKNREEFADQSDTDFAYEVPGMARFRVNVFRNRKGVGAVLRLIPEKIPSADQLGLPPAIRKLCELHKGLVVVTGPSGSGKSTTLAAMIDLINETRSDHILTIEDPIEFVHYPKRCVVNQREVHNHTQSFSRALRAALREDPDIIMIGELRDLETIATAIETAETGHLVFGTLHTNTAISTVDRLVGKFPTEQQEQIRMMLSESLKSVVAQTLVKKKGGGRVAALEILIVDKAVSSLIREGNTHMMQNHMITQKTKGNSTLNDALLTLVTKGLIEPKDAYDKAIEKDAFLAILQQKGLSIDSGIKSVS